MQKKEEVIRQIEESKELHFAPSAKEYFGISLKKVRAIAQDKRIPVKEIEIAAWRKALFPYGISAILVQ